MRNANGYLFTTLPGRSDRASLQAGWQRGGGQVEVPFVALHLTRSHGADAPRRLAAYINNSATDAQ